MSDLTPESAHIDVLASINAKLIILDRLCAPWIPDPDLLATEQLVVVKLMVEIIIDLDALDPAAADKLTNGGAKSLITRALNCKTAPAMHRTATQFATRVNALLRQAKPVPSGEDELPF